MSSSSISSSSSSSKYADSTSSSAILESGTESSYSKSESPIPTPPPKPVEKAASKSSKSTLPKERAEKPRGPAKKTLPTKSASSSTDLETDSDESSSLSSDSGSSTKPIPKAKKNVRKPSMATAKRSKKTNESDDDDDYVKSESASISSKEDSSSSFTSSSSSSYVKQSVTPRAVLKNLQYSNSRGPRVGTPRTYGSHSRHSTSNNLARSGSRGPSRSIHYSASATPGQIRVLSESSDTSSEKEDRKGHPSDSESDDDSVSDMIINEDDSDDENDVDVFVSVKDEKDNNEKDKGKKPVKGGVNGGIELSVMKENDDDDNESGDSGNGKSSQKPHKHKPAHKAGVMIENDEVNDNDDEDTKESKKKRKEKDKKKKGKKRIGKGKRKGKKKKKKTLKKKIIKPLKRLAKNAKSSIRFSTISFFVIVYIFLVVLFSCFNLLMYRRLRSSDFEAVDADVNRVSRSILDDLSKLSSMIGRYSISDQASRAVDLFAAGNRTLFDKWHYESFYWDGEWSTTIGYNILSIYDANHTCLYADYHPPDGEEQATTKEGVVPEFFLTKASEELSLISKAAKGDKDDGRHCMIFVPPGTNISMMVCHHPIKCATKSHTNSHGYMLMAVDLSPRLYRLVNEYFGCISLWDDVTVPPPEAKEAISNIKKGGIAMDGSWGGDMYHKYYGKYALENEVSAYETKRVCASLPKFKGDGKHVASYFLFPKKLPGHPQGPLLRVDQPAAMEMYGERSLAYLIVVYAFIFLVFIVVLTVYLDYVVLRRISSLSKFLDSLSREASNERQDVLETHKIEEDYDKNLSSKTSKHSRRERNGSVHSHSVIESSDSDDETSSTSASTTSTSTTASTTTSASTTSTATTTSTASTTSSKVNSVASSESTVTGTTGTSGTSGSSGATTTTSSESGDSTGDSGNKHDEVLRVQKSIKTNIDILKDDITAANVNIKKERQWRRRCNHALRLMNLWCGRKDIFPGVRTRDKPANPSSADNSGDENGHKDDPSRGYEDMSVDEVLARPIAMEFLKVHCRFEESQENIFFLLDVTWLQELERLEEVESDIVKKAQMHDTVVSVADHIVKRYIAPGSPQEINISAESMSIVRQLSGTYSKNMFSKAIYDVKMMTSMDVLSRFKHTPAFAAMSEALDVETYDMMLVAVKRTRSGLQRRNSGFTGSNLSNSGGGVSTGEIQVSAPGSDRNSADARSSDAFGGSDDEDDEEFLEFEDEDEDHDDNDITKIDKPFRSTFRLMSAISDGAYKLNTNQLTQSSGNIFSAADGGSLSDSEGTLSSAASARGSRGTKATAIALKDGAGSGSTNNSKSPKPQLNPENEDANENDARVSKRKKKK